ncbi:PP2C family protein-serine/threonine phosphatase [Celeribacter sp.]|uniref:PP2C family protein-serine/threonine phosphatase n=1 Tax=Celeribacter sp. TaxID=1890673 RepID=UPI003A8CBFF7
MTDLGRRFRFDSALKSDVGRVRKINEDSALCLTDSGIWVVADGMGGHAAGDFASQTITGMLETVGVPVSLDDLKVRFMERLSLANARIIAHAQSLGGGTVGATLASVLIHGDRFACVWSGDSRVYRFRAGQLLQISRDHTEVQALLDAGSITEDQAANWPRKNVITRAIGVTDIPQCDVVEDVLLDRDLFLICSDGLTEYYENDEIASVLAASPDTDLDSLCAQFVSTAVERGGKDNISLVLFRCHETPPDRQEALWAFPEFEGTL